MELLSPLHALGEFGFEGLESLGEELEGGDGLGFGGLLQSALELVEETGGRGFCDGLGR